MLPYKHRNKQDQLGMPFGTANARLKRRLLFSLVERLNENHCYRCGKLIERSEDLSIDHKKNWLNIDVKLYWDLDNIAFSHKSCNYKFRENLKTHILHQ